MLLSRVFGVAMLDVLAVPTIGADEEDLLLP
jgi:hypothetical protein